MRARTLTAAVAGVVLVVSACTGTSRPAETASTTPSAAAARDALPGRWWQWTESVPPGENPIDDRTGADCAVHQPDDVWFLAGTHGGSAVRRCTVPPGRPVYLPVINSICTVSAGESVRAAQNRCAGEADDATASLDGRDLTTVEASSPGAFRLDTQVGSVTGLPPGPHPAVTWGVWLGPLRLSRGNHVLIVDGLAGTFHVHVEYHLVVSSAADV